MGTVVSANRIGDDGVSLQPADLPAMLNDPNTGLIELAYAYGPHLLPAETPSNDGLWRYRDLLPIDPGPIRYPLAVGGTPLVGPPRLRHDSGLADLWLKDETRSPTGSNKDRATALVLEGAMRGGISTVTAASTGNVAVSLAVGAAAAGIEAVIFVPAQVHEGKLRLMLLAGATVFRVEEGYEAAFELSRAAARAFGWLDRNTGTNPWTVEAKKTVAFEIWEGLGRTLPDVVVVPVGDGTTLSAMAKGFRELMACGATDRMPRILGVQAEGCQPLKRAWEGLEALPLPAETIADGIAVVEGINAVTALRDVRGSGGAFAVVSDRQILDAIQTLGSRAGIIAEPAAAAGYAVLDGALRTGLVRPSERVVVLITGTGLKTPQYLTPCSSAVSIRSDLDQVANALEQRRLSGA
jgi:threonine synthase